MSIRRSIGVVGNYTVGIALMLALAPVGLCQTTPDQESEPASSDTLEEIIVYGDKSIIQLRREFYLAEANFFAVFNSLNSNDEFDVRCEYVTFLGSRRKHRLCQPKFARKAEARATQEMLASGAMLYMSHVNRKKLKEMDELLWQEMSALIRRNMELQLAFTDLSKAKQIYETERQSRCDGRGFFCQK